MPFDRLALFTFDLPSSHPTLFLSSSCPSCPPICFGGEQLGTGRRMLPRKPLAQCHKSPINGEQKTSCSPIILCFASGMGLLFCPVAFPPLSEGPHLRAAGLRSVVRITTALPVIQSCLIWKSIGIFYFPYRVLWQKSLNYLLSTFIQKYWKISLFVFFK